MANHNPPTNAFQKGNHFAGNRKGKRLSRTVALDVLGQEGIDELILLARDMAKAGNTAVLVALLGKILPTPKTIDVTIDATEEKDNFPTIEQLYSPDFQIDESEPLDSDVIDGDFTECSDG